MKITPRKVLFNLAGGALVLATASGVAVLQAQSVEQGNIGIAASVEKALSNSQSYILSSTP